MRVCYLLVCVVSCVFIQSWEPASISAADSSLPSAEYLCEQKAFDPVWDPIYQAYANGDPEAEELLWECWQIYIENPVAKSYDRARLLRSLCSKVCPATKQLLLLELTGPTSYLTARSAAELIKKCDLSIEEHSLLLQCVSTVDADIAVVDPLRIEIPPYGAGLEAPVVATKLLWDHMQDPALFAHFCSLLRSYPESQCLFPAMDSFEQTMSANSGRWRLLYAVELSNTEQGKNDARKLVHELENIRKRAVKEHEVKKFLLKDIEKRLDATRPLVQGLIATVQNLTDEEVRTLILDLPPITEEMVLPLLQDLRGSLITYVNEVESARITAANEVRLAHWAAYHTKIAHESRPPVGEILLKSLESVTAGANTVE